MLLRTGGDGKGRVAFRYGIWSTLWVAGHVAGGALTGGLLGWSGSHLTMSARSAGCVALGIFCLVWALAELRFIRVPMPQWSRQVPRPWLGRLSWDLVALGYGVQLGSAVATRIKVTTTYAAFACALLVGSMGSGAVIMAVFGLARALPALIAGPMAATPEQSRRIAARLDNHSSAMAAANATALIVAGALLVWAVWEAAMGAVFS